MLKLYNVLLETKITKIAYYYAVPFINFIKKIIKNVLK